MTGILQQFSDKKVMVIGDIMIDAYVWGHVDRISPEAPVPVVQVYQKEKRLGGAANVALNLKALGAQPYLCAVAGKDPAGADLVSMLESMGIPANGILEADQRVTSIKTRVASHNHQILRIDEEITDPLSQAEAHAFERSIFNLLESQAIDVVIFQDYDKGTISPSLIEAVTGYCRDKQIPVAVDPKKNNFLAYRNATIFKPNLRELKEGLQLEVSAGDPQSVIAASRKLRETLQSNINLITLSERGMFIDDGQSHEFIPAIQRSVADVSGAGDTVISVAALGLAAGMSIARLATLANIAGGLVCEKFGVVPINAEDFGKETAHLDHA